MSTTASHTRRFFVARRVTLTLALLAGNPIPACKGGAGGCCGQTCGKDKGASASDYQFAPAGRDHSRKGGEDPVYGRYDWLGGFGVGGGCDDDSVPHLAGYVHKKFGTLRPCLSKDLLGGLPLRVALGVTDGHFHYSRKKDGGS